MSNNLYLSHDGVIYKDTASFISTLLQYRVEEIQPIGEFFRQVNSNVSYDFTRDNPMTDYVAKYYYSNPELHKRVVKQLQEWDTGIADIEIAAMRDMAGKPVYISLFTHDAGDTKKKLLFSAQSNGTKLLYNCLKDFFIALDTGGVLIFDELDAHLHSAIVPLLLNCFLDPIKNPKNAQLIFSTHATGLMDTLKKY